MWLIYNAGLKLFVSLLFVFIPFLVSSQRNISGDIKNFYDSENLLLSTVKIEVYIHNKVEKSKVDTASGTSFIFTFDADSLKKLPVLVTNRHVINGSFAFSISMTRKNNENRPILGQWDTKVFTPKDIQWIFHSDSTIDLAITPLLPILDKLPLGRNGYAYYSILEDDIPQKQEIDDLKGVEELLMIGYPIGIWDNKNNMPITRKGITATHPTIDYRNRSEFVIDAACFPGSSGSPILIVNEGTYSSKTGIRMGKRRLLMGILYAGPTYQPNGEIKIIEIPTRKDAITIIQVPLNLGYVIKSARILDFKQMLGIR
jgi:hypothetical protein